MKIKDFDVSDETMHVQVVEGEAVSLLTSKTGSWRAVRPVLVVGLAPCTAACPAGIKIRDYLALIQEGKVRQAWELLMEDNPIPSITGRICLHPCEGACNRRKFDESVAINTIERFLGDYGLRQGLSPPSVPAKKERVAIIGSGPAGLSAAYYLAKEGYPVTIFEALPVAGGRLHEPIKENRLPGDVLEAEIDSIRKLGVDIKTNTMVGKDITLDELFRQGYEAIFVAVGADGVREKEAISQASNLSLITKGSPIEVTDRGTVVADKKTLLTGRSKVYAGGSVLGGPRRAVDAIAVGKRAALVIKGQLTGQEVEVAEAKKKIVRYEDLNVSYFKQEARQREAEIESDDKAVVAEAKRCFHCGSCNVCNTCWFLCPDGAIQSENGQIQFDYDYCKGCGVCAEECPRGAVVMEEESR